MERIGRAGRLLGAADQFPQMMEAAEDDVGPAEGYGREPREESSERGAERQGTDALHPPQIELGAPVNAVEHEREFSIGPQQPIASQEVHRFEQVGQL